MTGKTPASDPKRHRSALDRSPESRLIAAASELERTPIVLKPHPIPERRPLELPVERQVHGKQP